LVDRFIYAIKYAPVSPALQAQAAISRPGQDADPARWLELLDELMGKVAGRFRRVEPRRRARAFVLGLLAGLPRKNCWTIAEHAGDATPGGMQHLLARAVWDEDRVRDDVRGYVIEHLGDPGGGAGGG
jgi:SRSO17 transposase